MVDFRQTEIKANTAENIKQGSKGGIKNRYCEHQELEAAHTSTQENSAYRSIYRTHNTSEKFEIFARSNH